ncbi:OmpH family outer membrane protein [Sutterella megalosphaeroides]|uniref:Outer membrane protein chaperone n=1 Tax=Sutterella megalosphaeroides TaxID=2494234 RepID=A0A2Z6IE47_9BURK|nr:OmpH family outer membrane protein [Sutterella megalosphaeroides]BBF22926.1 outer membrane protein chaperone [Sutterella megalosphaeroides]
MPKILSATLLPLAALTSAALLGAAPALAAESTPAAATRSSEAVPVLKIGVVNMERILRDAKVAQEASDRLNAEGQRRQEEIDALARRFKTRLERFEREAKTMDEASRVAEQRALAEMERDVTRRNREARDEFNQRRNEEVLLLQNRAGRVIQEIARSEKFDLVLYEFFYASDRVDLTNRVIEALDRDAKPAKSK